MPRINNSVETTSHTNNKHTKDIHMKRSMKKILRTIYSLMEAMGRAKAAACLARNGRHAEAKALMMHD